MNTSIINYTLHLADTALIMGHRNSEWCGHGPVLEQDIAISNIALDFIGQARNFYQYAASLSGNGATEDTLAYLRDVQDFKNLLITEIPNGDWAQTICDSFYLVLINIISISNCKTQAMNNWQRLLQSH